MKTDKYESDDQSDRDPFDPTLDDMYPCNFGLDNPEDAQNDPDKQDDIDTGSRYNPDVPVPLSSCANCNPRVWKRGSPCSGSYRCDECACTVDYICLPADV